MRRWCVLSERVVCVRWEGCVLSEKVVCVRWEGCVWSEKVVCVRWEGCVQMGGWKRCMWDRRGSVSA